MTYTEILHQQIEQLPASYHAEASRYLEFLLGKTKKSSSIPQVTQNEIEEDNSQKILALLNEISSRPNSFTGIDGVEWQKEQRQDRVLVGRNED